MSLHGRLIWSQRSAKVFPAMQIDLMEYDLCHTTPQKTVLFITCTHADTCFYITSDFVLTWRHEISETVY